MMVRIKNTWIKNTWIKFFALSLPTQSILAFTMMSFLEKGISLITTPIFTRLLSSSDYGLISVFNFWLAIVFIFTTLNLSTGIFGSAMIHFEREREAYLSSTLILSNLATVIVFLVYWINRQEINVFVGLPAGLIFLIFSLAFFNPALNFWVAKKRYIYENANPIVLILLNVTLSPIIAMIFVWMSENHKGEVKVSSALIVPMLFSVFYYFKILKEGKSYFNKKYWFFALGMALPLIPHYLAQVLLESSDKIMISKMIGLTETGFYSLAYTIGSTVTIFWIAINTALTPWLYERLKLNHLEDVKKRTNALLMAYAFFCVFIMLIAPELMSVMAPSEYLEALPVIPLVIAGAYYTAIFSLFSSVQFYHKQTRYVMLVSIASAILNVGLNYLFVSRFGYIAAAYTTLLTFFLNAFSHYFFMRKIERREIYDVKWMVFLGVLLTVLSFGINYLYAQNRVRYLIVFGSFIALYLWRNKLRVMYKKW